MKKDKETLRKELEKEAPFLARQKEKPQGFIVPEGYFEQLQKEVRQQIAAPANQKARTLRLSWRTFAAAASVAALAGAALFLFRSENPAQGTSFAALSGQEMHEYISQNIDEFDLEMLLPFATASITEGSWLESANPDDPDMQEYMYELLDEIDLETLEELL